MQLSEMHGTGNINKKIFLNHETKYLQFVASIYWTTLFQMKLNFLEFFGISRILIKLWKVFKQSPFMFCQTHI